MSSVYNQNKWCELAVSNTFGVCFFFFSFASKAVASEFISPCYPPSIQIRFAFEVQKALHALPPPPPTFQWLAKTGYIRSIPFKLQSHEQESLFNLLGLRPDSDLSFFFPVFWSDCTHFSLLWYPMTDHNNQFKLQSNDLSTPKNPNVILSGSEDVGLCRIMMKSELGHFNHHCCKQKMFCQSAQNQFWTQKRSSLLRSQL